MQTNAVRLTNGDDKHPNPPEAPPLEDPTGIPEDPIRKNPPIEEPPEYEPGIQEPSPQPVKPDIVK